jgi:hypothetical protein
MKADKTTIKNWALKNNWLLLEEIEETEENFGELRFVEPTGKTISILLRDGLFDGDLK